MNKTRLSLLLATALLLALAIAFALCDSQHNGTGQAIDAVDKELVFPRQQRERRKRSVVTRPSTRSSAPSAQAREPAQQQDSLEAAVLKPDAAGAVFFEANAIFNSPLVDRLSRCLDLNNNFEDLAASGVDPRRDIDRIAIGNGVVAVSGFFDKLDLGEERAKPELLEGDVRVYDDFGEQHGSLALVGTDLIIVGASASEVREAVQRTQGKSPAGSIPEFVGSYGEVYGYLGPEMISSFLAESSAPVSQQLQKLLSSAVVRSTVDEHLALSVDLEAKDPTAATDLARSLGGVIAGARLEATRSGETELAQLLEKARVEPGEDNNFSLDLALPGDFLLRLLGCSADGDALNRTQNPLPHSVPNTDEPSR